MSQEQKKLLPRRLHYPTPWNGHSSQTNKYSPARILNVNPETLARTVEDFLVGSRDAVVMEDGAVAFDLAQSKYSVSGEHNKCVLQLEVQRLGQVRPSKLEICRARDRRTPTAKRAARLTYLQTLGRLLEKKF